MDDNNPQDELVENAIVKERKRGFSLLSLLCGLVFWVGGFLWYCCVLAPLMHYAAVAGPSDFPRLGKSLLLLTYLFFWGLIVTGINLGVFSLIFERPRRVFLSTAVLLLNGLPALMLLLYVFAGIFFD